MQKLEIYSIKCQLDHLNQMLWQHEGEILRFEQNKLHILNSYTFSELNILTLEVE